MCCQLSSPKPFTNTHTHTHPKAKHWRQIKALKAKTVHKITEYLTLFCLAFDVSVTVQQLTFFDPPCTPYFSLYYCILAVTHSCHKLLMSTFNKDQWWWWRDDDDVCLCDGRLLRRHMLSPHQPLSVVSCCFYCFKLWRVTVWISPG